jgi:hypothetical protein
MDDTFGTLLSDSWAEQQHCLRLQPTMSAAGGRCSIPRRPDPTPYPGRVVAVSTLPFA